MPKDLEMRLKIVGDVFFLILPKVLILPAEHGFKALVGYSKKEKLWWAYGVMTKRPKCAQVRASPLSH
jgi:hypothetical protein